MKLRDPKTATLIANQLMTDVELVAEHCMLIPEIRDGLVYTARASIAALVQQVVDGVISVTEWYAMTMDVKDIICKMLQEGYYDQN